MRDRQDSQTRRGALKLDSAAPFVPSSRALGGAAIVRLQALARTPMTFADLGLSEELLRAITEAGYTEPTPIQAGAIPPVLMNRDLIGIAQTGTGKTASFVLPMIDILAHGRSRARMP